MSLMVYFISICNSFNRCHHYKPETVCLIMKTESREILVFSYRFPFFFGLIYVILVKIESNRTNSLHEINCKIILVKFSVYIRIGTDV